MQLAYVIMFVDDMSAGVAFYRDTLGLPLRFAYPEWAEFDTGPTTLALHPSSKDNPAGITRLGFRVADMQACRMHLEQAGVRFTREPAAEHGVLLAEFVNPAGVRFSLSAPVEAQSARQ
jgi:catechol 2,3-dioxygenase-like lactoylglutathione lyase family enzyme